MLWGYWRSLGQGLGDLFGVLWECVVLGDLGAKFRVVARAPRMLILDEATSNVGSDTKNKVQAAIERVFAGRSVLVIAHRLSTVRNADKILVFDSGEIVESGDHQELMALGGSYAELYNSGLQEGAGGGES